MVTRFEEEVREGSLSVLYQTPEPLKSLKSAVLPSTGHSLSGPRPSHDKAWKSRELPKDLFSNQLLREFRSEKEVETEDTLASAPQQLKISHVMKRVQQLLADSDDERE
jgi:hypothetical protein